MTIPVSSTYPDAIDSNRNLYAAHDSLRVRLASDYNPGDTSITIDGDAETIAKFPPSGLITLTEQVSAPELRALSFFYGSRTDTTFDELEILSGFTDVVKPKKLTYVTQNVMAEHHKNLVNALIAIETFIGVKGTIDTSPLGSTLEGRVNFLRKLALSPKAWFSVNKHIGLVPLTIEVQDLSFRLGTDGTAGEVTYVWDFGDNTSIVSLASLISNISVTDAVPIPISNVLAYDLDGGKLRKTYNQPGIYDIILTVTNDFGSDSVTLPGVVNVRMPAPDEAVIRFNAHSGQTATTDPPTIRASSDTIIDIEVPDGINSETGRTYGGELVDGNYDPIDPIVQYTWNLGDDLTHLSSKKTKAIYTRGDVYDLILRVDTEFGSYRITEYEQAIDIIEKSNLWLWTIPSDNVVNSHEFGLVSETFKIRSGVDFSISRNDSFLDDAPNEDQQKYEFSRNCGFTPRGTTLSGNHGTCLLYWASGRNSSDSAATETINVAEYNGFSDTYSTHSSITRPWNWTSFSSLSTTYFIQGNISTTISPDTSPTNPVKTALNLVTLTASNTTLSTTNYKNGAEELQSNVALFDDDGEPLYGHMSVYRSCWKGDNGYFLRNDGVGTFFRIKDFYKTESVGTNEFQNIRKLPSMAGAAKLAGELVTLSSGVFFFNNSGSISAYNDTSGVWETGGPGVNSTAFRGLQDSSVLGFDDEDNTLVACSDGDHRAYLSFDYSDQAYIRFNDADLTFSSLGPRPSGDQWQAGIF